MRGFPAVVACLAAIFSSANVAVLRAEAPRLAVVISIDQFCYEYLVRMRHGFSPTEGAFLRLCDEGANFVNCHHGHAFTVTAPGHSVMLTGAFPGANGIIDNAWFDRVSGKEVYCVDDATYPLIGAASEKGGISPRSLLVGTLGDVMKLNNPEARVVGLALKDRAGVLMAGHLADAAYWFDSASGNWVTSTYYADELPGYMRTLNESDAAEQFAGQEWSLLHATEMYRRYPKHPGDGFPYTMPDKPTGGYFKRITVSPFGNELTLAAARVVVTYEKLGKDEVTDLLCINLSSNDYVGHAYGPHSLEVQDITFRTDRQLEAFFRFLNSEIGAGQWTVAITADHGVAPVPEFATDVGLPAGRDRMGDTKATAEKIEGALRQALGTPADGGRYVQAVDNQSVYLDRDLPELLGERAVVAQRVVRDLLLRNPIVAAAYTREELLAGGQTSGIGLQFQRAFNPARSGDVLFALAPYQVSGDSKANHGSPWKYDTHVPLLLWGAGIRPGKHTHLVTPAQLAPTLARLLQVEPPDACSVEALEEALAAAKPSLRASTP